MSTLLTILKQSEQFLQKKGISNALFNTEILFSSALNCKRIDLYLRYNCTLNEKQLRLIRVLLSRRAHHEPLQYIIGEWPFHELTLNIDKRALIPRQETEFLVEYLIKHFRDKRFYNPRVLDLGTGSGAIALSLAKEFPRSQVVATDNSSDALSLAKENAQKNKIRNITFILSSWYSNINDQFDLIVSNPPYLSEQEWIDTESEVKFYEPKTALVADNDGQADLIKILQNAPKFLQPDGMLVLETGATQHKNLLEHAQSIFYSLEQKNDQFGRDRFLILKPKI